MKVGTMESAVAAGFRRTSERTLVHPSLPGLLFGVIDNIREVGRIGGYLAYDKSGYKYGRAGRSFDGRIVAVKHDVFAEESKAVPAPTLYEKLSTTSSPQGGYVNSERQITHYGVELSFGVRDGQPYAGAEAAGELEVLAWVCQADLACIRDLSHTASTAVLRPGTAVKLLPNYLTACIIVELPVDLDMDAANREIYKEVASMDIAVEYRNAGINRLNSLPRGKVRSIDPLAVVLSNGKVSLMDSHCTTVAVPRTYGTVVDESKYVCTPFDLTSVTYDRYGPESNPSSDKYKTTTITTHNIYHCLSGRPVGSVPLMPARVQISHVSSSTDKAVPVEVGEIKTTMAAWPAYAGGDDAAFFFAPVAPAAYFVGGNAAPAGRIDPLKTAGLYAEVSRTLYQVPASEDSAGNRDLRIPFLAQLWPKSTYNTMMARVNSVNAAIDARVRADKPKIL